MRKIPIVLVAAVIALPTALSAQDTKPATNPVTESTRQMLAQHAKYLIASAELMPAEKYSYHPTEPQMTFGQLIVHIVQTNSMICSGIGDLKIPDVMNLAATDSKDTLVVAIKQSFTHCSDALAKLDDGKLGEEVTMMGKRTGMPRARAVLTIVADWADHYSTAAAYLRLNGILPPSAKPKK